MALKISDRGEIPAFIVMDVMQAASERAQSGEAVYHLEVGQPSSSAPEGAIRAAEKAMRSDALGYTVATGIPALRQAIAAYYGRQYGLDLDWKRIFITTGSSGAFLLSFLAAFNAGDRVALAAPGYPCYRHILSLLGIEVVSLMAGPEDRFQPTVALLEEAKKSGAIDGLIVANPSNPTGTMLDKEALVTLSDYCAEEGIRFISDEIYQGISYGFPNHTMAAIDENAVIINSFSKYFSMTGWRLGWMVLPEDMIRPVECLAQNLFISPPTISQYAGIGAMEDSEEELQANLQRYAENRDILLAGLPGLGFDQLAPSDGAFYIYAEISKFSSDSKAFCEAVLRETGVAITPGLDFDPMRGGRYIRMSFARSKEDMTGALDALGKVDLTELAP